MMRRRRGRLKSFKMHRDGKANVQLIDAASAATARPQISECRRSERDTEVDELDYQNSSQDRDKCDNEKDERVMGKAQTVKVISCRLPRERSATRTAKCKNARTSLLPLILPYFPTCIPLEPSNTLTLCAQRQFLTYTVK